MERVRITAQRYPEVEKPFVLTAGQSAAVDMACEIAANGESMSLCGQAGSGKSTVTKEILDCYDNAGVKYALTAMTHKACAVVKEKTGRDCRTTHSALCLAPRIDYKTGKEVLRSRKGDKPPFGTLLICDEASVAGSEMYKHMSRYQNLNIGDEFQLAPIGEDLSPTLFLQNKALLSEVMRHDSEILDLSTALCDAVRTGGPLPAMLSRGTVHVARRSDFEEEYFCALENDIENTVYLGWTNSCVTRMIGRVRRTVLKRDKIIPEIGEIMISNDALIDPDDDGIILANNTEVTVEGVEMREFEVDGSIVTGFRMTVSSEQDVPAFIDVATDTSELTRLLNNRKSTALREKNRFAWKKFFYLKSMFADMRFPYASTVHKSQGSTHRKTFVNVPDIMKNKDPDEVARLLYVACSRPSQELWIQR